MAITFQVSRNENAIYKVSHPCPNSGVKKPEPSVCRKCQSQPKSTADGLKIHEMARKVSGIIDRSASAVANMVPNRRPITAGIARMSSPTIEMPNVHQAIGVWIGVNPAVESLKRSTM